MEKWLDMLGMHGYAEYVWPCYAIAALVMSSMAAASLRSLRKAQKALAELQKPASHES